MNEDKNILAIDIGGTSFKIGVVHGCDVIESTSVRNVYKGKSEKVISAIRPICDDYITRYNIQDISIGCPGDISNGVVLLASNLGWKNYDILSVFKEIYPTFTINVDNDGNAACQAEIKYGLLKNVSNGLFMTIGRGIGGAIIIDGHIIHGVHNAGGKFGHMVIHTNGRKCNCGRRGCFETYASVLGLIQTIKEINEKKPEEERIDTSDLSGFKIVEYYKAGVQSVIEGLRKWHYDIAEGLLDLCMIFDPSIIVIAGGITESGLLDLNLLKTFLKNHGYPDVIVSLATFKGKTGMVGAAALLEN